MNSGTADQLTATAFAERDPKLSPDGRFVSYRHDHDLYVLEIATKTVTRLTRDGTPTLLNGELDWVYPEELDLGTAHWWSPDGRHIAYLQFDISREWVFPQVDLLPTHARYEPERFPQPGTPNADVRLGIVPVQGGETRWMDLGDTRDALLARVKWSPDSQVIYAERLNRIQNRLDLLASAVDTGATRLVLREQDPYWINVKRRRLPVPRGRSPVPLGQRARRPPAPVPLRHGWKAPETTHSRGMGRNRRHRGR
ncbi:MAG: DPP IV N-terminal domain-containing protein [Acidobacteria bacterium]|nr:DPP IV N-terminal domain-containing protein [Acidobacteriota bacterium]